MNASDSASHLTALLEATEDGILAATLDGKLLYWNAAAEKILGRSREDLATQSLGSLIREDQAQRLPFVLERLQRGEAIVHLKTTIPSKDGSARNVSLNLTPVRNENGDISALSILAHDATDEIKEAEGWRSANQELEIRVLERTRELMQANETLHGEIAERRAAEEELKQARQIADEANQSKSQFVANMSHEMRTPLAAILGYAEMMYDSRQSVAERLGCIGRIRQNVKNLTELIDDILDLSKVEAGRIETRPVTFSVLPELGEVFSSLQSQAWKKRLSFDINFEGEIPETVTTDPLRFRQTLTNIISNAVKFTERGGVHVNVKLGPSLETPSKRQLYFEISDTGVGIPAEQQEALFQPFVQGDSSLNRIYGGTGLGLVLSRQVARALGGDVTLERSQPGRGSMFLIRMDPGPTETVNFLKDVTKEDLHVRHSPPLSLSERRLEGMRVLLVEDAADIQVLISHFLRRSGAHVEVAENGFEAIKKARAASYDLVLMDIQMPVLNGYEATAQLHAEGFTSPIVALTAHAMKGVKEKCLAAGCTDYLTKPINASALIDLLLRYRHAGEKKIPSH